MQETNSPEAPAAVTVEIDCAGTYYSSYEQAWPAQADSCEAEATGDALSKTEKRALKVAYGTDDDLDSLGMLYGMCAEAGNDSWNYLGQAGSPDQVAEVSGALILCPDHPQKGRINKLLAGANSRNKLEKDGRIFGAGVLRVGSDIKAGAYYATDVEDCYWERTDAQGAPIDNYFTNGAKRVQVTIQRSDYSFNSEGCGQWRPVGS
ncbi:hypothetical protein [Streptomyces lydicus]|uniref:hypothetical protein n=1 Tax=Streptomyces lydicus TaxID=47763 RepID=UPI0037BBF90B